MENENLSGIIKKCGVLLGIYVVFALLYGLLAGETLFVRPTEMPLPEPESFVGEVYDGISVTQSIVSPLDRIDGIVVQFGTYNRTNRGVMHIFLEDEAGNVLTSRNIRTNGLQNNQKAFRAFDVPVEGHRGEPLRIRFETEGLQADEAITFYYSEVQENDRDMLRVGDREISGALSVAFYGAYYLWYGRHYAELAVGVGLLLALFFAWHIARFRRGERTWLIKLFYAFSRYSFLLQQLVSRGFTQKYKRSALGVLWSFLNPLLTMCVQYVVFSTIFKRNIVNFPIYLFTGIITFSFFSQATTAAMRSITGNASLITKVYVPKYIFTISTVLSAGINTMLSLIPLAVIMVFTGTTFAWPQLLIPFVVGLLILFCIGVGLLLATVMVFFRDMAFLWSVVLTMLQYLTPVFYPISIIPESFLPLYKLNPLYHFVTAMRAMTMQGQAPGLPNLLVCILSAAVALLLGAVVFRRNQDKMILKI